MKKILKLTYILLIILIICISPIFCYISLAEYDPASSHGFADYSDAEADSQAKNQMKEQEEKIKENATKSNNNYLSALSVDGYSISPSFESQTLNYEISEQINSDEININATTADSKAKVSGTGKIQLQSGENNFKIDVIAENGDVRAYYIKVNAKNETKNTNEISNVENTNANIETLTSLQNDQINKKNNNYIIWIIAGVVILILIFLLIKIKKNHSKH